AAKFSDIGAWFNFGGRQTAWTDNGVGAIEAPLEYLELGQNGADLTFGAGYNTSVHENKSIGFNVKWQATDRLTLEFDAHTSEAQARPDSPYGYNNGITSWACDRDRSGAALGADLPLLLVDTVGGVSMAELIPELQSSGSSFRN